MGPRPISAGGDGSKAAPQYWGSPASWRISLARTDARSGSTHLSAESGDVAPSEQGSPLELRLDQSGFRGPHVVEVAGVPGGDDRLAAPHGLCDRRPEGLGSVQRDVAVTGLDSCSASDPPPVDDHRTSRLASTASSRACARPRRRGSRQSPDEPGALTELGRTPRSPPAGSDARSSRGSRSRSGTGSVSSARPSSRRATGCTARGGPTGMRTVLTGPAATGASAEATCVLGAHTSSS